jgi:DMSO/TMAO reductase YedYZ heme-binding membrane subunit
VLRNKTINEWNLFWLITGPISIAMVIAMSGTDLSNGEGVSAMIQTSVRCAVPTLYLAFAASSVQILFPGPFGMWMLRNRKYFGMCFAAAMAWQGLFILWLTTVFSQYYIEEVYLLRDAIEGTIGYLFLAAMTLTSFRFGRKHLEPRTWKILHKSGIYFIWAYAFSVYWWALFYYPNPILIDYVYYWGGFLACGLRIAAWAKKRRQAAQKSAPESSIPLAFKLLGSAIVGFGLLVASFGLLWQKIATDILTGPSFSQFLLTYLPYWPFEPYFSLFIIGLGAFLLSKPKLIKAPPTLDSDFSN